MTTELEDALGTDEKPSLKASKKAIKKPSKGEVVKGKKAKAKLEAAGDKKTKVKGVDDKPKAKKAKDKVKPKKGKKADAGNRGVRHGNHTAAIEEACKLIKKTKPGTSFTTREVKDKWPDGPSGWAFREAGKKLAIEKLVKFKNVDRANTITRL